MWASLLTVNYYPVSNSRLLVNGSHKDYNKSYNLWEEQAHGNTRYP